MKKLSIVLLLSALVFSSCVAKKDILYLQGTQNPPSVPANYEPLIQRDDILYINISSRNAEAVAPFNLDSQSKDSGSGTSGFVSQKQTYLVDNAGNIEFPILGTLNAAGYSVNEFRSYIKGKLDAYVTDAVINVRIMNFKVTVTGEVGKPGVVSTTSQRLTLFDALAMSGDLTLYAKRDNILIVRDFQGVKSYNRVDITRADFVNSAFYYLDQNDLIYVEPRKSRI